MEVVHGSQMQFQKSPLSHREGGILFKQLLHGDDRTPENFSLALARQNDFYAPVHHHNFEQFRFALQGDTSLGPNTLLKEGQLSYHGEGTYYGPQKDEPGEEKIVLLLQYGGASGQGYMSFNQLSEANQQLSCDGQFKGGKYYAKTGGVKDGYQALWEHVNGRVLQYPKARYHAPIVMDPESYVWQTIPSGLKKIAADGNVSAWKKTLGVYTEREVRAEQIRITKGGCIAVGSDRAIHLLFVLTGTGSIKSKSLTKQSCVRLEAGKTVQVASNSQEMTMLHFVLPLV
ncbi:hypothetical protein K431DRAFT_283968 [Polychaeton citri CBS 116435]|uniref:RmlC-like cupin n=1 Tax=Polychaeton citri CBS 116435 TaxID=1314669 RepID=A0A9P4QAD8_9PEZI|nr:hypothetical protein K431DRAFT_283968 [Polychaeton citri CBS 116435]